MKYPTQNGESSTTTTSSNTAHAALNWTGCYDDGCFVHLGEKQGSGYYPRQPRREQPRRKAKTLRWGEPVHHDVGDFVVDLQERMVVMMEEIDSLRAENREMKKRVVMAEEAVRRGGIENRRRAFEKLELLTRTRSVTNEVAKMAQSIDNDNEFAEFIGISTPPESAHNEGGANEAQE